MSLLTPEDLEEIVGRELVRCVKCGSCRYPAEVFYSKELKDYVCRNVNNCTEGHTKNVRKKVLKMRRRGLQTVKLP